MWAGQDLVNGWGRSLGIEDLDGREEGVRSWRGSARDWIWLSFGRVNDDSKVRDVQRLGRSGFHSTWSQK